MIGFSRANGLLRRLEATFFFWWVLRELSFVQAFKRVIWSCCVIIHQWNYNSTIYNTFNTSNDTSFQIQFASLSTFKLKIPHLISSPTISSHPHINDHQVTKQPTPSHQQSFHAGAVASFEGRRSNTGAGGAGDEAPRFNGTCFREAMGQGEDQCYHHRFLIFLFSGSC